jgi:hypothetical protein
MEIAATIVVAIVSVVSVIITVVTVRSQAERQVGDLYDQLVQFRIAHPEVMSLSRRWEPECLARVYAPQQQVDTNWVVYYSYVELCLGYCNAVLSARRAWRLGGGSFTHYHKQLVTLILTEHNPIVEHLLTKGGFVSRYIIDFRKELQREGWNWREKFNLLPLPPS